MSIHVSKPYSNIQMDAALNIRILKLSLIFADLNIDLSLTKAAYKSPIQTLTSRSVDPT